MELLRACKKYNLIINLLNSLYFVISFASCIVALWHWYFEKYSFETLVERTSYISTRRWNYVVSTSVNDVGKWRQFDVDIATSIRFAFSNHFRRRFNVVLTSVGDVVSTLNRRRFAIWVIDLDNLLCLHFGDFARLVWFTNLFKYQLLIHEYISI
jgi:hypothetical protein